jgi:hypothetical protein
MADPTPYPDSSDDTGAGPDRGSIPSTPRWVKVFGLIAIVLALFVLFVVLTGIGGPHGPGRHMSFGDVGGHTRWGLLILLGVLVVAAVALNWSWLVAIGIALPRHRRPHTIRRWPWWPHAARGWPLMTMTPRLRKFALTAHVTCSVGSLGAVAGFLALAVAGLTSQNAQMVRAAYLAMELTAWFIIVPLVLASLLTGLVQSLGTNWGLFRHYWVLVKLLLTVLVTIVLLQQMELISYMAGVAAETALSSADLRAARRSLVIHAAGGLLVLLVPVTLAVYKPRGMTRYGARKQHEQRALSQP